MKATNTKTYGLLSVAMIVMGLGLNACSGGGGGGGGGGYDPYWNAWYDVYGNYCGTGIPLPGCNYFADGYKIVDTEDPAFYSSWNLTFNTWVYTDVYGNPGQLFIGWGWVSPTTGILYDEFGYAVNSKEKQGRDSQTAKAAGAKDISRKAGVAFAEKWGLEEQAGIAMADDLRKWAEWSKTRKRDEAALNSFTTEFTGSSNNEIKGMIDSYLKGDSSPVMTGIDNVAAHRHIANPDTVAAIIKDWYKEYIPQQ